jgi:hypothetical protein
MIHKKESSSFTRSLWMIARITIVIMIFILLVYFDVLDLEKVQKMIVRWWSVAAAIFFLSSVIISMFRWQILLNAVGIQPGFKMVMRLSFIGYAFSTVIPGAVSGDIIKAYYIVKGLNNKRTAAATTIVMDRVVGLFTMLLTAAVAIGGVLLLKTQLLQDPKQTYNLLLLGCIVISLAITMLVGFLICLNQRLRKSQFVKWVTTRPPGHRIIDKLYSTIYSFREKKQFLFKAILASFVGQLPLIIGMYCIGRAADETVLRLAHYLFLAPVALILNAIPIGPGGMGSGEAFVESLFMLFGSINGSEVIAVFHIAFILFSVIGFLLYIKGKERLRDN